jgi:hypothetical protein
MRSVDYRTDSPPEGRVTVRQAYWEGQGLPLLPGIALSVALAVVAAHELVVNGWFGVATVGLIGIAVALLVSWSRDLKSRRSVVVERGAIEIRAAREGVVGRVAVTDVRSVVRRALRPALTAGPYDQFEVALELKSGARLVVFPALREGEAAATREAIEGRLGIDDRRDAPRISAAVADVHEEDIDVIEAEEDEPLSGPSRAAL